MKFLNKSKRNRKKNKNKQIENHDGFPPLSPKRPSSRSSFSPSTLRIQTSSLMSSLGTGMLGRDGSVSFVPSPTARSKSGFSFFSSPIPGSDKDGPLASTAEIVSTAKSRIIGRCCSFLRVSDLAMDDESLATMSVTSDSSLNDPQEHSIRPVVDPPPGIESDPNERWVALCTTFDDESNGASNTGAATVSEHTPIAPLAIQRLANFGLTTTVDETMWQPDSKSEKLIKKASGGNQWMKETFSMGLRGTAAASASSKDVLVWSGSFKHGLYASEIPAFRSAGVMDVSSKKLMELLVDSTRVKEYNKISLGRTDVVTFDGSLDKEGPFGKSITKVMRAESKPPMMSNVALTTLLHAKQLPDASGYLIVTRAVHRPGEESSVATSMKPEIVIGVNLIMDFDDNIDGGKKRCLMINVNHMYSPMVPMYIAKRLAVTSAHKFVNDIRELV